jgi:hypothetical protein
LPVSGPSRLPRCTSGSTSRLFSFRGSFDGLHFHYRLHALLSSCSPPPLTGTQLPAHSSYITQPGGAGTPQGIGRAEIMGG